MKHVGPTLVVLCTAVCLGCGSSEPVDRSERSPSLPGLLAHYDDHYDADRRMLCLEFDSPGYHSRIPSGTPTHPTRESLVYAVGLLQRNDPGDAERAAQLIAAVLPLQDTQTDSPTYGIWPWLAEEPLAEMSAPDFNWADFCGAALAQMLAEHADQLPDDLRQQMLSSLGRAVQAIRRRDVQSGYTNIAIVGGGVCAAAGELLDDPDLLDYGRTRLQKVVEYTQQHGGFSEYNSPAYTRAAIAECERALQVVRDPAARKAAESLRRTAWQTVADSFHGATQQWAGPHSRSYEDRLRAEVVEFLSHRTGISILPHPSMIETSEPCEYAVVRPLPCPDELLSRFRRSPAEPRQVHRTFLRSKSPEASRNGTTWLSTEVCLGSVNRSIFWTQRKPLIAYWKTDEDPAVVFRLRFLHDGRDFSSMGLATDQDGPRALSLFHTVPNRGDWHPSLDRPADGVFPATDLRVRYEIRGAGVAAEELSDGRYALTAGNHRVVIHTCAGSFAGHDVVWQAGQEAGLAHVDGICYRGDQQAFPFRDGLDVRLAVGIELIRQNESCASAAPALSQPTPTKIAATWETRRGRKLSASKIIRVTP